MTSNLEKILANKVYMFAEKEVESRMDDFLKVNEGQGSFHENFQEHVELYSDEARLGFFSEMKTELGERERSYLDAVSESIRLGNGFDANYLRFTGKKLNPDRKEEIAGRLYDSFSRLIRESVFNELNSERADGRMVDNIGRLYSPKVLKRAHVELNSQMVMYGNKSFDFGKKMFDYANRILNGDKRDALVMELKESLGSLSPVQVALNIKGKYGGTNRRGGDYLVNNPG